MAGISNAGDGRLYISTDSGSNWWETGPEGDMDLNWRALASSSNGNVIIAGVHSGRVYRSYSMGATWSEKQPHGDVDRSWDGAAVSPDGAKLFAVSESGVSYSFDSGLNWGLTNPDDGADWRAISCSSDGKKLFIGAYNGRLYIGVWQEPPTVVTKYPTSVGAATATFNGRANANDSDTTVTFEYGPDTTYGTTVTADQSPVTGTADTAVSKAVSGLSNTTTYHYRVKGENGGGATYGADMTFTTGMTAPTVTTNAATGETATGATFNGTVNPNGNSSTVTFEYGPDTNYGTTVTADQSPLTGSTNTAVSATVSDLIANLSYHYRVLAANSGGATYGADMTFMTSPVAPVVSTNAATSVTSAGATLNGGVNANGDNTTVTFQYGLDSNYGTNVTADQSPVTGNTDTAVSKAVTGLSNNTTYHYRVAGQNSQGVTYGADMTFITGGVPPSASTNAATSAINGWATFNGTVNSNGDDAAVTFEYGTDTNYGTTVTAEQSPATGGSNTAVSATVSDLIANLSYHYRVVAANGGGVTYGADMTFASVPAPPIATTDTATSVGTTSATLHGAVTANGAATTVSFEYGTDTTYGSMASAGSSLVTGFTCTDLATGITGLDPGTTYHYRVSGGNSGGLDYGADMTFTTATPSPGGSNTPTPTVSGDNQTIGSGTAVNNSGHTGLTVGENAHLLNRAELEHLTNNGIVAGGELSGVCNNSGLLQGVTVNDGASVDNGVDGTFNGGINNGIIIGGKIEGTVNNENGAIVGGPPGSEEPSEFDVRVNGKVEGGSVTGAIQNYGELSNVTLNENSEIITGVNEDGSYGTLTGNITIVGADNEQVTIHIPENSGFPNPSDGTVITPRDLIFYAHTTAGWWVQRRSRFADAGDLPALPQDLLIIAGMVMTPTPRKTSEDFTYTLAFDPDKIPTGFVLQDLELMVYDTETEDWEPVVFEEMEPGVIQFTTRCFSAFGLVLSIQDTACPILQARTDFTGLGENRITLTGEALADVTSAPTLVIPEERLGETAMLFMGLEFSNGVFWIYEDMSQAPDSPAPAWRVLHPGDSIKPFGETILESYQLTFDVGLADYDLSGLSFWMNVYLGFAGDENLTDFIGNAYKVEFGK